MVKEIIYPITSSALDKIKEDIPLTYSIEKISVTFIDERPKIIIEYFSFGSGKKAIKRKIYD